MRKLARPYRNILRVLWLVAFLFLFAAGAVFGYLWWADPEESTTRQALGGITYLLATFALAIAWGAAAGWWYLRGIYRWLEAFEKGDYLAYWTCSDEEWQAFLDGEPQRRTKQGLQNTRLMAVLGAFAGVGFIGLCLFDQPPRRPSMAAMLGIGLALPASFTVFGLAGTGLIRRFAQRRAQRLRFEPGDVYIGRAVAYCAEECWDWLAWKTIGFAVELIPGAPALLRFSITTRNPRGGDVLSVHHVPVPEGSHADAERVIRLLQGKES